MSRLRRNSRRVLRLALSFLFFATALGKAIDVEGFIRIIETYRFFPLWSAPLIGVGIVTAEGGLAVWLLSGRHLAISALLSAAVHAGFIVLSIVTLLRGIDVPNCGCFGVFLPTPLSWLSVAQNFLLLAGCLTLYLLSDRKLRAI